MNSKKKYNDLTKFSVHHFLYVIHDGKTKKNEGDINMYIFFP